MFWWWSHLLNHSTLGAHCNAKVNFKRSSTLPLDWDEIIDSSNQFEFIEHRRHQTRQKNDRTGEDGWWGTGIGHNRQQFSPFSQLCTDSIICIRNQRGGYCCSRGRIVPHPVHRIVLFFSSTSNWHKNFPAGQITDDKGIRGIFCLADLSQEPKVGEDVPSVSVPTWVGIDVPADLACST